MTELNFYLELKFDKFNPKVVRNEYSDQNLEILDTLYAKKNFFLKAKSFKYSKSGIFSFFHSLIIYSNIDNVQPDTVYTK